MSKQLTSGTIRTEREYLTYAQKLREVEEEIAGLRRRKDKFSYTKAQLEGRTQSLREERKFLLDLLKPWESLEDFREWRKDKAEEARRKRILAVDEHYRCPHCRIATFEVSSWVLTEEFSGCRRCFFRMRAKPDEEDLQAKINELCLFRVVKLFYVKKRSCDGIIKEHGQAFVAASIGVSQPKISMFKNGKLAFSEEKVELLKATFSELGKDDFHETVMYRPNPEGFTKLAELVGKTIVYQFVSYSKPTVSRLLRGYAAGRDIHSDEVEEMIRAFEDATKDKFGVAYTFGIGESKNTV